MCVPERSITSRYCWKWQSAHRHLTFTFATTSFQHYLTLERPSNRNTISAGIHSSSKTNSKMNIQRPSNRHPISAGIHSSSKMPIIPKNYGLLPSGSQSEALHHNTPHDRVGELLEDWPCPMSDCTKERQSLRKKLKPRVTFSEMSSMQLYHVDPLYAISKSYSKEDFNHFSKDIMMEAARIKNLVHLTSSDAYTKESFRYLIENHVILPEEIQGIEHLISKSAYKLLQERRNHPRAVLLEQDRMEALPSDSMKRMKCQEDIVMKLATFSSLRSSRSAKRARIRASTAAWFEEV